MTTPTTGQYVKLKNLCTITCEKLKFETLQNDTKCVIISRMGTPQLYYLDISTIQSLVHFQYFLLVPLNSEFLNSRYLYYYLLTHKHELNYIAGTYSKGIIGIDLSNLEILIPSLEEQLNIAKSFDDINTRIAILTNELCYAHNQLNSDVFFKTLYNKSCDMQVEPNTQSTKDNLNN